jgi:hypothetical protein
MADDSDGFDNEDADNNIESIYNRSGYSNDAFKALSIAEGIRRLFAKNNKNSNIPLYSEFILMGLYHAELDGVVKIMFEMSENFSFNDLWRYLVRGQSYVSEIPENINYEPVENFQSTDLLPSENTRIILEGAADIAAERDSLIKPRHILLSLLRVIDCVANKLLSNSGVDTAWVEQKLQNIPDNTRITLDLMRLNYEPRALHPDIATSVDWLGFKPYANALARVIKKKETIPPVVIGVYGEWGSGKSSFMEQVAVELKTNDTGDDGESQTICINYNAWAYTDTEKLWDDLVRVVASEVSELIPKQKKFWYWLRKQGFQFLLRLFVAALPVLIPIALISLAFFLDAWFQLALQGSAFIFLLMSGGKLSFSNILSQLSFKQAVDAVLEKGKGDTQAGVISDVQSILKDAINLYFEDKVDEGEKKTPEEILKDNIENNKLKLVVFIDELDRCPLEKIVGILEAIKLFLAEQIFIVLLAIDTRVLAEAIRLHYKEVENPDLAREYMEKIIQIPVPVPQAKETDARRYVSSLMKVDDERPDNPPVVPAGDNEGSNQTGTEQENNLNGINQPATEEDYELPDLKDTSTEQNAIIDFATKYLDNNPRQIRRLINTYRYVKLLVARERSEIREPEWQSHLVYWLGFTMRWPDFIFHFLECNKENIRTEETFNEAVAVMEKIDSTLEYPPYDVFEKLLPSPSRLVFFSTLANNFLIENPPRKPVRNYEIETKNAIEAYLANNLKNSTQDEHSEENI